MRNIRFNRRLILAAGLCVSLNFLWAQSSLKLKYNNSTVYTGIEVGSKCVKMSMVELGKNAQSNGSFNILKDTSVNTDFISFSEPTSLATLNSLSNLYGSALKDYNIPANRIFTVVSSGVKMQAEKENKTNWVNNLVDSFRLKINEPKRKVEVVSVLQEARLSHLGIVPIDKRHATFLIDIGSGNAKGGYFPNGNTKDFYLFQLNWGTKSVSNTAEKRLEEDKSIGNYQKQLTRVLSQAENSDIVYAVNASGAYPLSDYIAFSGGAAWAGGADQAAHDLSLHHHLPAQLADFSTGNYYSCQLTIRLARPYFERRGVSDLRRWRNVRKRWAFSEEQGARA
jgi:hypothetical protein